MPYRLNPKNKRQVQVKKSGKWKVKKAYRSKKKALKLQRALYLNVTAKGKG